MNGIPFTPEMIRTIVEGKKTQTRRLVKPQPIELIKCLDYWFEPDETGKEVKRIYNPRYSVGEVVYIKETYYKQGYWKISSDKKWVFYESGGKRVFFPDTKPSNLRIIKGCTRQVGWYKRSPLFMPEWAARHFLRITDVRPERLWSITEDDAIAEGCKAGILSTYKKGTAKEDFASLWDLINPKDKWATNPFVWVYAFKLQEFPAGVKSE